MNKELFLLQLERLLYNIPKEEREEAMDYYRSYFEDAGAENEALVLEELESPQSIADSIIEALNSTGTMTSGLKNPPQVRGSQAGAGQRKGYKSIFSGSDFQKNESQSSAFGQDADRNGQNARSAYENSSDGASYRRYDQYEKKSAGQAYAASDRRSKLLLFLLLAVFTAPIWGAALSGMLGVVGVLIAVVVVLGVCSIGGVIGGIVCTVVAVAKLCTLSLVKGLFMLGIGMLLIAASGVSMVLLLLFCGRFLPWTLRQISRLLHKALQWGRSAA